MRIRTRDDLREVGRRDVDIGTFETLYQENLHLDSVTVGWRSRFFNANQRWELTGTWAARTNDGVRRLLSFIQRNIGSEVLHLRQRNCTALRGHEELIGNLGRRFDEMVLRFMEGLEHEGRQLRQPHDFFAAFPQTHEWWMDELQPFPNRISPDAQARAKELLISHLTPLQLEQFRIDESFATTGSDKHTYVISNAHSFNVRDMETGEKWCGQVLGVPIYDQMLGQKLLIEHDVEDFKRKSNRSRGQTAGYFVDDQERFVEVDAFGRRILTATEVRTRRFGFL